MATCQTRFIAHRRRHYGKLSKIFEKALFYQRPKQASGPAEWWRNKQYMTATVNPNFVYGFFYFLSQLNHRHFVLISTRVRQAFCFKDFAFVPCVGCGF